MKTRKPNQTIAHIQSKLDGLKLCPRPFEAPNARLTYSVGAGMPNGMQFLTPLLVDPEFSGAFFPDANLVIDDRGIPFWQACEEIFRNTGKIRCGVSVPVYSEILERLNDPWNNVDVAESLKQALHSEEANWAQTIDITQVEGDLKIEKAFRDYMFLFSMRRRLLTAVELGGFNDGKPVNRNEAMNFIRKEFGPRAELFVKKANKYFEKNGTHILNDEAQVMTAILFALYLKKQTTIISFDADIFETFYKMQYLIDTHYRAMLTGDQIAAGNYGESNGTWIDQEKKCFADRVTFYEKRDVKFRDVLPNDYSIVPVNCIYIAPNDEMDWITFNFESEMLRVFETRSETKGLSTDKFGGSNIHIELGPVSGRFSDKVGIGKDVRHEKDGLSFCSIDQALVWFDND